MNEELLEVYKKLDTAIIKEQKLGEHSSDETKTNCMYPYEECKCGTLEARAAFKSSKEAT